MKDEEERGRKVRGAMRRTEHADAVVDRNDDDATVRRQNTSVVSVSGSEFKVVSVHEHHNRK